MAAAGTFAIVLTAVGVIFGILLVIAPLAIWHHVAMLRKEQEKANQIMRAQYDVLIKILTKLSK